MDAELIREREDVLPAAVSSGDIWLLFGAICAVYVGISLLTNTFVLTDAVYYRSLGPQSTIEQMQALLAMKEKWSLVGYITFPLLLLLKVGYAAVCISIGAILADYVVRFGQIFMAALACEVVFLAAAVLRLMGALWFVEVQTLEDFAGMFSFSLLDLLDPGALEPWLQPALRGLNLYELFYCAALGLLLARLWRRPLGQASLVVAVSYGTGLVLWLAAITFVVLQIS